MLNEYLHRTYKTIILELPFYNPILQWHNVLHEVQDLKGGDWAQEAGLKFLQLQNQVGSSWHTILLIMLEQKFQELKNRLQATNAKIFATY